MPYGWSWLIPERVIHVRVSGELNLSDVHQCNQRLWNDLVERTQPVHVVVDVSALSTERLDVAAIRDAAHYLLHPNMGLVVVCGASTVVIPIVLAVLSDMLPFRYRLAETATEALRLLADHDTTLAPALRSATGR